MSRKETPVEAPAEDLGEAAEFLNGLRKKALTTFIGTLMVLYSFFGNIYRIPMQIEQQGKEVGVLQTGRDVLDHRLSDLEKLAAARGVMLAEAAAVGSRVNKLEDASVTQGVLQSQVAALGDATKQLTKVLDTVGNKLTELSVNVTILKETNLETRRSIDELKRK